MAERRARSIIKTVSWRVFASLATMVIVYVFTGKIVLTLGVGAVDIITKLVFYYLHERIWNYIKFGRVAAEAKEPTKTPY